MRKEASENLYTSKPTGGGGGGSQKIELLVRGATKISSFKFQYLHHPPLFVILDDLSLTDIKLTSKSKNYSWKPAFGLCIFPICFTWQSCFHILKCILILSLQRTLLQRATSWSCRSNISSQCLCRAS